MSNPHNVGDEQDDASSEMDHERDELHAQGGNKRKANRKKKVVSKLRCCRAWEEFFDMFNGPFWSANCGGSALF